jgi:hypothetical protein
MGNVRFQPRSALRPRAPEAAVGADRPGNRLRAADRAGFYLAVRKTNCPEGVSLAALETIRTAGFEIAVVGSAIAKSDNPPEQAKRFSGLAGR